MGESVINITANWCKACGICVAFCPKNALALDEDSGKVKLIEAEACSGCRLCEFRCPDFAIDVDKA